ncbi:DNA-directed RNA polymerases I and III subunit RPAC1 [Neolecta irregularis DAH-3]|uniref:DNA-directed RNA polymerases I and III subunit RPAC1 n=1 Tax=Neolecta irregularis (strain DAH-3) TaxID=1198029 RepID=A0A1U7LJ88_NEOID|nr:DNA-directed RNA polymerases I and III subunit RPAC1 [Neolecta irregularis DAH-3]|eukprot:OLL22709.1 DNA-directed RNA polymerases I and III subunit RPAC1 [Neolecta irregularis DAH-3]
MSKSKLERSRTEIGIEIDRVTDVTSTDFPGHWPGEDNSWDLEKFKSVFKIQPKKLDGDDLEFDLIHVDASIANAFRRILIAEIPTMAIEYVYVGNNTSVIQDEVLAQRLGLIPIKAHPDLFEWYISAPEGEDTNPTDQDTIVLSLRALCERNPNAKKDETDPLKLYSNAHILAGDIKWESQGRQSEWFAGNPIDVVNKDILIAKLRPGQEIDITMHAIKGIGKDHAKFSPVSTASYRLLPTIHITSPITGADARKFQKCFPKGVIDLIERNGEKVAVVRDTRKDTVSRECLRYDEFKDKVKLGRIRDHFIFSIESTGIMAPDELFIKSVQILREKCLRLKRDIAGGI